MREKPLRVLCVLSVVMLYTNVCSVFAKAPDTAKIMFGTYRGGNRELYLMNPDGSEQVNITNHRADDVSVAHGRRQASRFFLPPTATGGRVGICI